MKLKLFKSLCAALFLASTLPGASLICARPCAMTQRQLLACAKACASLKGSDARASLSNPACVRVQAKAEQNYLSVDSTALSASAFESSLSFCALTSVDLAPGTLIFSRGSPSFSPVTLALLEVPSQNSPPTAA